MKFRHILCALILAGFSLTTSAADQGVLLLLTDGSSVGFTFSQKPKMIVGSDELQLLASTGDEIAYPYSRVKRTYFGDITTTGINRVTAGKTTPSVLFKSTADGIEVEGLKAGERVTVYGIDGTTVASATAANDGGTVYLQIPFRSRAVYIVRTTGGISYKFLKK